MATLSNIFISYISHFSYFCISGFLALVHWGGDGRDGVHRGGVQHERPRLRVPAVPGAVPKHSTTLRIPGSLKVGPSRHKSILYNNSNKGKILKLIFNDVQGSVLSKLSR